MHLKIMVTVLYSTECTFSVSVGICVGIFNTSKEHFYPLILFPIDLWDDLLSLSTFQLFQMDSTAIPQTIANFSCFF